MQFWPCSYTDPIAFVSLLSEWETPEEQTIEAHPQGKDIAFLGLVVILLNLRGKIERLVNQTLDTKFCLPLLTQLDVLKVYEAMANIGLVQLQEGCTNIVNDLTRQFVVYLGILGCILHYAFALGPLEHQVQLVGLLVSENIIDLHQVRVVELLNLLDLAIIGADLVSFG